MSDTQVLEKTRIKLAKPKRYHVILLNDDFTTFEFVIAVLVQIFNQSTEQAFGLTMKIHESGRGIAGTYGYEIADQKRTDAMNLARQNGYPLEVILEESS
jgi:ATP-dependent Clp protease adaptor protein ClpS